LSFFDRADGLVIPQELIGTIPGWITAVGMIGLLLRYLLGNRKMSLDAEGNLRTHMGGELQSLRNQIIAMGEHHLSREREIDDRWRKLLHESEERHDECVKSLSLEMTEALASLDAVLGEVKE